MMEKCFAKYVCFMILMSAIIILGNNDLVAQNGKLSNTIYKDYFAIDGHTHDLVKRNGEEPKQAGIDRLKDAGVNGIILFFPLNNAPVESVISQMLTDKDYVKKTAAENKVDIDFVERFTVPNSLSASYQLQILTGGETDGLFSGDLKRVDQLKAAGVSVVVLDANDQDNIADKRNDKKTLSGFGRKLVKKLNDNNITIDISHLSEELQFEVMKLSAKPVLAGHANAKTIANNDRNISDEAMKCLFGKGGILLFTFCKPYLFGFDPDDNANGIEQLLKHMDYVAKRYGTDKIGIGTDYGGAGEYSTKDMSCVECFSEIADRLVKRGYSNKQVKQIMGGNIIKFFSDRK